MRTAVLPLVLLAVAAGSAPAAAPDCDIEFVAGVGPACERPDGLMEVFDAQGRSLGLVHGPDFPPSGDGGSPAAPMPPSCVENSGMRPDPDLPQAEKYFMQVIYAHASDRPDRYASMAPLIRGWIEEAQGALMESANAAGHSMRYRVACVNGETSVWGLGLPTGAAQTTFSTIKSEIRAAGFDDPRTKLWVWFDGTVDCGGCVGLGNVHDDSGAAPTNVHNGNGIVEEVLGPDVAVIFGYEGSLVFVHENAHTLGAVQIDAPNTTGAFHCNDGSDYMCYADGGPRSDYSGAFCATATFDCNHNDYFHPDAPEASYLAGHWNLGHPFNRYLEGCFDAAGRIPVGLPTGAISLVNMHGQDLPVACRGHPYAVQGLPRHVSVDDAHPVEDVAALTPPHDFEVCWWNDVAFLRCDHDDLGAGWEQGRVPDTATRFELRLRVGASVDYLFRVV